ncbi:IS21 family transposase [Actinomadura sp. 6K520]|uniref:IS21 family transposase n=1 Tax=Actinomadura sp. 6K520 TaxID=2530364 RepID=UPI00104E324A|nr:IS21 family transposase [Actinomadura sp. 6K520]TDE22950.1 IS21 family transposase [Actinomadura sp. 6K520]
MAPTKAELFDLIRRDSWREGLSVRALARKYGVHRRLVREALTRPEPAPRKTPVRRSPKLDPFKKIIDEWLRADLDAPKKQRHTTKRIYARLAAEHGMADVGYTTVRDYVSRRRPEIRIEEGRGPAKVFIPQHHPPGLEAEVDFGELWVRLAGVMTKCYLFVYRMSYSGKAVHQVFATCGQEAFLEGHVHAFTTLGGLPTGQIRYDNLTSAVQKIVFGQSRARVENPRWRLFRSHYRFEAFYCQPGIEGAHEKGGVEQQVGYFRRNYLVPVPQVASLQELNDLIERAERAEDARRIGSRIRTIGQDFAQEAQLLRPLPDEPFETGLLLSPRVDRSSKVTVRCCLYSVPVRFIGRQVRVVLRSSELVVFDRREEIARHPRLTSKGAEHLVLDHYLEALMRKPGAMAHSTPLEHARAQGVFTQAHEALWSAARRALGEPGGTRALIEVLLLHRHMDDQDVIAGIGAALSVGSFCVDVVAVEARKAREIRQGALPAPEVAPGPAGTAAIGPKVTPMLLKRVAELRDDDRPLPNVEAYDQLLRHRRSS